MIATKTELTYFAGGTIKITNNDFAKIIQFDLIPQINNDMIWLTIEELKDFHIELGEYIKVIE